jgi:hypothetical protein
VGPQGARSAFSSCQLAKRAGISGQQFASRGQTPCRQSPPSISSRVSAARPPSFWPTRQAQRLAGGTALGELEANPQLNCYRWCLQVPQPPKSEFSRLNTQSGATHASKRPARPTAPIIAVGCWAMHWVRLGHCMPLQEARRQEEPTWPSTCASQLLQACSVPPLTSVARLTCAY